VKGKAFIEYHLPDEDFAYGKPNDYSHRMNYLIGNRFLFNFREYVWIVRRDIYARPILATLGLKK